MRVKGRRGGGEAEEKGCTRRGENKETKRSEQRVMMDRTKEERRE